MLFHRRSSLVSIFSRLCSLCLGNGSKISGSRIVTCEQPIYRFFLNAKEISEWFGTVATTYSNLRGKAFTNLRLCRWEYSQTTRRWEPQYPIIPNAGWHFSSIGGLSKYIEKIEAYSHAEADLPENKTQEVIDNHLNQHCQLVPLDDTFPSFILDQMNELKSKGLIY